MTFDPSIREQGYQYFLQEAPELLQVLQQGLLSLREDCSINKVNTLMRATHTLKGAAASIGLETIATVAHSFEDVFKALCNPDASIDREAEALLFEGFECFRLALEAELSGASINHVEVLDRTAAIFAQLQEKLGDWFGQEAYLPTSVELGFDVTQSIFEVGVTERLNHLTTVLAKAQPQEVAATFRSQAEVFIGLAESLNLPGFGATALAAMTALDHHPDQVVTIAKTALADFKAGHAAVLAGDRAQGGQPSEALQQLASRTSGSIAPFAHARGRDPSQKTGGVVETLKTGLRKLFQRNETAKQTETANELPDSSPIALPPAVDLPPSLDQDSGETQHQESANHLLENIWGTAAADSTPDQSLVQLPASIEAISSDPEEPLPTEKELSRQQPTYERNVVSPKTPASLSPTIRVNVEHLDRLNYSVGELLTNQNRQSLQAEQTRTAVQTLYARLQQHQQLLTQLQDWADRQSRNQRRKQVNPLQLDAAIEAKILVQSLLDDMVQLTEANDAIDWFTRQSGEIVEKQGRLLTGARDALIEARMLPLGYILDRFPAVLRQLETLHDKQVKLKLRGTEVMVDKVVVEKLYDPLLHLVRNAFDHGIEPMAVRQQRGKAAEGQIRIYAHNQGRHLVIEVRDDGNGLDFDLIRHRAIERHLISTEQALSLNQTQLTDLLFEPGFSTVSQVNDLSGRGVGLDVVRDQLKVLRGSVTVHSEPRQGTTFTLQIPLSLTIAPLLLCQAGSKTYALLDDEVEQILLPQREHIHTRNGGRVLQWSKDHEQQLVPIRSLAQVLNYTSVASRLSTLQPASLGAIQDEVKPIILIRCPNSLLGLEVDQLLGEQELVIRPLGTMVGTPNYVHGASILADGQLALVLDGAALLQETFDQTFDQHLSRETNGDAQSSSLRDRTNSMPWMLSPGPQQSPFSKADPASPSVPVLASGATVSKRVLIVEDSITVRQNLALTLQKAGYQVFQAEDGYDALEQFQRQTNIQLVICDLEMPRMSGYEFLRSRQQMPALAQIPVMMLTSRNDEQHRQLAEQLGANAYMTKPYMEYKLLGMIAELLERTTHSSKLE